MSHENTTGMGVPCPHCGKALRIADAAVLNVANYQRAVNARAVCCGRPVRVGPPPPHRFTVEASKTTAPADDWGNPYTRPSNTARAALRHHVTGAIERGEAQAITEQPAAEPNKGN